MRAEDFARYDAEKPPFTVGLDLAAAVIVLSVVVGISVWLAFGALLSL